MSGFGFIPGEDGSGVLVLPPWLVVPLMSTVGDLAGTIAADAPEPEEQVDPLAALVGIEPGAEVSDDPALARLFPDAYVGDDEAAAEFRRYTRRTMREAKLHNAELVLGSLEQVAVEIDLSAEEVQAWLRTLNDVRLVAATRLGIETEEDAMLADRRSGPGFEFYNLLGGLLGLLVEGIAGDNLEPDDPWTPPADDEPAG